MHTCNISNACIYLHLPIYLHFVFTIQNLFIAHRFVWKFTISVIRSDLVTYTHTHIHTLYFDWLPIPLEYEENQIKMRTREREIEGNKQMNGILMKNPCYYNTVCCVLCCTLIDSVDRKKSMAQTLYSILLYWEFRTEMTMTTSMAAVAMLMTMTRTENGTNLYREWSLNRTGNLANELTHTRTHSYSNNATVSPNSRNDGR